MISIFLSLQIFSPNYSDCLEWLLGRKKSPPKLKQSKKTKPTKNPTLKFCSILGEKKHRALFKASNVLEKSLELLANSWGSNLGPAVSCCAVPTAPPA